MHVFTKQSELNSLYITVYWSYHSILSKWFLCFIKNDSLQIACLISDGSESSTSASKKEKSAGKVMLIAFFDQMGLVYQHLMPHKIEENNEYYPKVLKALRYHMNKKWPEKIAMYCAMIMRDLIFRAWLKTKWIE